jgi:hypothetical protein
VSISEIGIAGLAVNCRVIEEDYTVISYCVVIILDCLCRESAEVVSVNSCINILLLMSSDSDRSKSACECDLLKVCITCCLVETLSTNCTIRIILS